MARVARIVLIVRVARIVLIVRMAWIVRTGHRRQEPCQRRAACLRRA